MADMVTSMDSEELLISHLRLLPTFFNKWENSKNLLTFEKWLLVSHIANSSDWHITPEF
jgi:hypothetical protein